MVVCKTGFNMQDNTLSLREETGDVRTTVIFCSYTKYASIFAVVFITHTHTRRVT